MRQLTHLLLIFLLLQSPAHAGGSAASNIMSKAMLSMMDAMGNMAQDYNRNKGGSSGNFTQPFNSWQGMNTYPWAMYGLPGSGIPGQQQLQGMITQGQQVFPGTNTVFQPQLTPPPQSPLDGIWQGQGGEMVLVMYGHFRIYANADTYRDGQYSVTNEQIIMYDPASGTKRAYDYALSEGRLVLRGPQGKLLLFRQLPIPIPPYALFTGQQSRLTNQQAPANQNQE